MWILVGIRTYASCLSRSIYSGPHEAQRVLFQNNFGGNFVTHDILLEGDQQNNQSNLSLIFYKPMDEICQICY